MEPESNKTFLLFADEPKSFNLMRSTLQDLGWKVENIYSIKKLAELRDDTPPALCLAIFNDKGRILSPDELKTISKFCSTGRSVIITSSESEEIKSNANINSLVSAFGVEFRDDCVIRPNPLQNYHPKEAVIQDFVANRGLTDSMKRNSSKDARRVSQVDFEGSAETPKIIYPYGCSLKVTNSKLATVMMTSSKWALPSEQAICAFHIDSSVPDGFKLVAIGSCMMFRDGFLHKESNLAVFKSFIEFVGSKNFVINISDAKTLEIPVANYTPDMERLLSIPIPHIQRAGPLPEDPSSLFDEHLFTINNSMLPSLVEAYRDLKLEKRPLTLIKPNLERVKFPIEPAVHGFVLRRPSK